MGKATSFEGSGEYVICTFILYFAVICELKITKILNPETQIT